MLTKVYFDCLPGKGVFGAGVLSQFSYLAAECLKLAFSTFVISFITAFTLPTYAHSAKDL